MPKRKQQALKVIVAPKTGTVLAAPPVLKFSDHTVDYTCGRCGIILMHADEGQVNDFIIRCGECGTYNKTGG